ncbi:hemerythrin family protein [Magnetovirga frankeli]|uniref:bacteriohemerythrin n=1 Tax=Magnetovirga frankeli TaxID=947516 RepID=UPI001293A910|nr:hemerythrin family protein [gamma proteobacterium SS-5]
MIRLGTPLLLGIPELDAQHERIAELVNAIQGEIQRHQEGSAAARAETAPACCRQVRRLMQGLARQIDQHFCTEEGMMAQCGYPDTQNHRLEHRLMLAEFMGLFRSICAGEACLKPSDLVALEHWFIGHLASDDLSFARFLKQAPLRVCRLPLSNIRPAQPTRLGI